MPDVKFCQTCGWGPTLETRGVQDIEDFTDYPIARAVSYVRHFEFRIICPHCGAATPWLISEEDAVTWWNEKTPRGIMYAGGAVDAPAMI